MTQQEQDRRYVGVTAVFAAACLWALLGVWSRALGERGVVPNEVAFWRAMGGGVCFLAHAAITSTSLRFRSGELRPLAFFAVVGVSVFYAAVPQAVAAGGVTLAFLLLYTAPVWVLLADAVVRRRRPSASAVTLVALTTGGTALVVSSGGSGVTIDATSVTWGLVAGVSYASYYVVGRALFDRRGAIATYAVALPLGAIPLAFITGFAVPSGGEWWLVAGLVFVSTYVPYQLLAFGMRSVAPSRAVVVATIEPVLAAGLGWAVYGERLSIVALAGAGIVLVAATTASIMRT